MAEKDEFYCILRKYAPLDLMCADCTKNPNLTVREGKVDRYVPAGPSKAVPSLEKRIADEKCVELEADLVLSRTAHEISRKELAFARRQLQDIDFIFGNSGNTAIENIKLLIVSHKEECEFIRNALNRKFTRSEGKCVMLEKRIAELESRLADHQAENKVCSQCEFFNLNGSFLFTTHRQNGKIYSQHVVKGSTCSVSGVERERDKEGFICREFRPLPTASKFDLIHDGAQDAIKAFKDGTELKFDTVEAPASKLRHGHIVAQTAEELQFSYFHCKTCGKINFEPDSHCPGPDSGECHDKMCEHDGIIPDIGDENE